MSESLAIAALLLAGASGVPGWLLPREGRAAERIWVALMVAAGACGLLAGSSAFSASSAGGGLSLPWSIPGGHLWFRVDALSGVFVIQISVIAALGVDIRTLYTVVFALGAGLAGLAGALVGALQSVQVGMGEPVLILAFVVIVIGGIGSIRGALVGAVLVGVIDTMGRVFLPAAFGLFMEASDATVTGSALASMLIYLVMALVLALRPKGLFPADA